MTRRRHLGLIAVATAPLLLLGVLMSADRSQTIVWAGPLWLLGAVIIDAVLWRTTSAPFQDVLRELDARSGAETRWLVRDLRDNAALCQADRSRMADLVEDLSSSLGEGLLVVDPDLKIRLINQVAMRFCGVEDVRPDCHLLEILRDPEVVEMFSSAAAGARWLPVVVENPRGLWEVRAFPVRGGGAVGLLSDVSLIRRASEFRRRFVQDLSHELRSPLTVMRTTVETLEDEIPAEFAQVLVRQVERIDRLANELHELASIESGSMELDLESVPVAAVVKEVVRDFGPEADRLSVRFTPDVPDALHCWCDRRGLYRVLSNLVDNAVKYNRRDGWVRISGSVTDDRAVIQVVDSGAGIAAPELKAVTQRFYRIERARTPGKGGLGLGLAIVKHMVQHMGGTLALDSRETVGTTVTITFPVGDAGAEVDS
jgi:signal transduction histidine kinase